MGKPWPYQTKEQLVTAGYTFDRLSRCSAKYRGGSCNLPIEWWTTPEGKKMPIDPQTLEPHWSTCVDRNLFRKPKEG